MQYAPSQQPGSYPPQQYGQYPPQGQVVVGHVVGGPPPGSMYGAPPPPPPQVQQSLEPATGTPVYADCTHPEAKRFVVNGYRDVPFLVAFVVCVIGTVIGGIYNASHMNDMTSATAAPARTPSPPSVADDMTPGKLASAIVASLVASFGVAFLSLYFMCAFPTKIIIVTNVLAASLNFILGIVVITSGSQGLLWGLLLIAIGVFELVWLYMVRGRIPFAAALLKTSSRIISRYKATVVVSVVVSIAFCVFMIFYAFAFAPASNRAAQGTAKNADGFLVFLGLLIIFWASQVTVNISHVTSSGLAATVFLVGEQNMPRNPTWASFKRSTTTSLGSICFGSLLVAFIKVLRALVDSARQEDQDSFLKCILACLLSCLDQMMEYFNVYAYTHVAIYGTSYIQAAKQTWEMLQNCGWTALINDCLVFPTLNIMSLANSAAIGIVAGLVARSYGVGIIAFLLSYGVHEVVFRCVYSSIVTFFVVYAEAPQALNAANPDLYAMVSQAHHNAVGPEHSANV